MDTSEANDWRNSTWFNQWLDMARQKEDESHPPSESEAGTPGPDQSGNEAQMQGFAATLTQWEFSLREKETSVLLLSALRPPDWPTVGPQVHQRMR